MEDIKRCLKIHETNQLRPNKELAVQSKIVFKKYDQAKKEGRVDNKNEEEGIIKNGKGNQQYKKQQSQTNTSIASNDNTSMSPSIATVGNAVRTSGRIRKPTFKAVLKPIKVGPLRVT